MARAKKFGRKRFCGNQHTIKTKQEDECQQNIIKDTDNFSSSFRKISNTSVPEIYTSNEVNIIIDINILSELLKASSKCKICNRTETMKAEIEQNSSKGLASSLSILCSACKISHSSMTSRISNMHYDVNVRFVYALRCIGKGKKSADLFCGLMNLPPPPQKFNNFHNEILQSLQTVSSISMKNAVEETVLLSGGNRDIAAAFDGTWQKRGHTSLNGVFVCTSLENGKVMDFECLSKYCFKCKSSVSNSHVCDKNYNGTSGGMEVAGVTKIFQRSEAVNKVRYLDYLGDGDCKAYDEVVSMNIYGSEKIEKLECIAHVQKRMGTRLRKIKTEYKKKKLSDGKSLSGKGRLTDRDINLIQSYYGLAIRRNVNKSVKEMAQDIWAIFFHKLSTDENPQHGLCPVGDESWCKYNSSKSNQNYCHKNSLPEVVLSVIKPVFRALTDTKLLAKCMHGKTQNVNESFNKCIWERLPKTSFHGLTTIKMGVMDAVICFNDGAQKRIDVLKDLGIQPGYYASTALKRIDSERIKGSNLATKQASKKAKILKQSQMKITEAKEKLNKSVYGAGAF